MGVVYNSGEYFYLHCDRIKSHRDQMGWIKIGLVIFCSKFLCPEKTYHDWLLYLLLSQILTLDSYLNLSLSRTKNDVTLDGCSIHYVEIIALYRNFLMRSLVRDVWIDDIDWCIKFLTAWSTMIDRREIRIVSTKVLKVEQNLQDPCIVFMHASSTVNAVLVPMTIAYLCQHTRV